MDFWRQHMFCNRIESHSRFFMQFIRTNGRVDNLWDLLKTVINYNLISFELKRSDAVHLRPKKKEEEEANVLHVSRRWFFWCFCVCDDRSEGISPEMANLIKENAIFGHRPQQMNANQQEISHDSVLGKRTRCKRQNNLPSVCFGVTTLKADCEFFSGEISIFELLSAFTWIFRLVTPSVLTFKLKSSGNEDGFNSDTSIFLAAKWKQINNRNFFSFEKFARKRFQSHTIWWVQITD